MQNWHCYPELSTHQGRRNVLTTWKTAAATVGHGRRNALAFAIASAATAGFRDAATSLW